MVSADPLASLDHLYDKIHDLCDQCGRDPAATNPTRYSVEQLQKAGEQVFKLAQDFKLMGSRWLLTEATMEVNNVERRAALAEKKRNSRTHQWAIVDVARVKMAEETTTKAGMAGITEAVETVLSDGGGDLGSGRKRKVEVTQMDVPSKPGPPEKRPRRSIGRTRS